MGKPDKTKNNRKSLPHMGKIKKEYVDTFKKEKEEKGLNYNQLLEQIFEKVYGKHSEESRLPLFPDEEKELIDIMENYESITNERLKITELRRLQRIVRELRDSKRIFYQLRRQDGKNLPDFVKNILDEHPPEEILYETLRLIQEILPTVKNDLKERELWYTDIFPRLKIILENKQTKANILEEAIKGLCAMRDEKGNLITIEYEGRKKNIDILGYLLDLQKRCFSWPEYKAFLERNAQGWIELYVKNKSEKDSKTIREFIFANIDEVQNKLRETYIHMKDRIDRRLDYVLKNQ